MDAWIDLMDFVGRLNKVLGAFLVGDSTEESHHLGIQATALIFRLGLVVGFHGIVYRHDLSGVNTIFINNNVARQVAHRDNAVGGFHASLFNGIHIRIDVLARAVKFGCMHVNH